MNFYIIFLFSLLKTKKIIKEIVIKKNKKHKIKIPLDGSFANVCTEFNTPDLTRKVPHILKVKVAIDKMIVQDFKSSLFSRTKTQ